MSFNIGRSFIYSTFF